MRFLLNVPCVRRAALVLAWPALLAGCAGPSGTAPAARPGIVHSYTVQVADQTGQPVAGAAVELQPEVNGQSPWATVCSTDAAGRCPAIPVAVPESGIVDQPFASAMRAVVSKPGHATAYVSLGSGWGTRADAAKGAVHAIDMPVVLHVVQGGGQPAPGR